MRYASGVMKYSHSPYMETPREPMWKPLFLWIRVMPDLMA